MSKKIIILVSLFLFVMETPGVTQTKTDDSLKVAIATVSNPLQRFNLIRANLERVNIGEVDNVDSLSCVQLLKIAQELKSDSLLAISYNWIGSYFSFTKGDMAAALEYYFKGLPLAEKVKDRRRISSLYFDIAISYNALQNYTASYENTIKGGQYLPEKSAPLYDFMLVQYQRNLCAFYLATNQHDSALYYAQRLAETANKLRTVNYLFSALFLQGAAYAQIHDNEMADLYFKRADAMSGSVRLNTLIRLFYVYYIDFLLNTGRIADAKKMSERFMTISEKYAKHIMNWQAAGFMRQVFDRLRQIDSAYYYSRKEAIINAQIFSQNNEDRIQSLAFNEEIRQIEEQARKTEEKEKRKQNIQYVLIALCIIFLVTLYLLLSRSFITNTKLIEFFGVVALLIVFEFLNLLLHPFLGKVTNHSPVLMLLALVCIAALLVPLHHRLENWAIKKLVEKNKRIRLALAKKTLQQLEQNSN